ncbi:Uncharacterised protein [Mycobacteroides abscessus subsp. massiliense]|uniref:hypothetical protein n=1 Tax=Mycobacteroides abscessus TaxID=36809 RepID=UPI0009A8E8DF|nr:hypothetical protein [Mycobacteroides abscessus]SKT56390.1 Uncharacterised protein [Mycobacteroides abscessus subsp. massiliense]
MKSAPIFLGVRGPFICDEMAALRGPEPAYGAWLDGLLGRRFPEPFTVKVSTEDTLRWMGIDPDTLGDLIGRVTAEFDAEAESISRSPHAIIAGSTSDWKARRLRMELVDYAVAGCTVTPNEFGGFTVIRPEGMTEDEFRELMLRVTSW